MAITKLGEDKFLIRVYKGRDPVTKRRYSVNETFRGTFREAERREQVLKVEVRKHPTRGSPNMLLVNSSICTWRRPLTAAVN